MTRIPTGTTPNRDGKSWALGSAPWQDPPTPTTARARVIVDNDFSGDPDDLYQLVHTDHPPPPTATPGWAPPGPKAAPPLPLPPRPPEDPLAFATTSAPTAPA